MKILYNIKWSFKQFRKYPLQSFINIFGLAIGLTVFMLIGLYINYQKSVDQFHENADKIYRLENGFGGITPGTYLDFYREKIPEIKYAARISFLNGLVHYQQPGKSIVDKGFNAAILMAEEDFLKMFDHPLIQGTIDDIYSNPSSIILSESLAVKLFGESNPINKVVTYDSENELTVKGVMKDVPKNSSIEFDAIIPIEYYKTLYNNPDFFDNWGRWMYETFFLFKEGMDINEVKMKFDEQLTKRYAESQGRNQDYKANQTFRPYSDIYFYAEMDQRNHGNKDHVVIFGIIAIFVLLIACINYINITTALASSRFKSLGIKKVAGASRGDIIKLILFEGIVIAFFAVTISILITEFTLPYFRELTFLDIQIPYSLPLILSVFIALPLILGLLAGLYPSFYLSNFKLTDVVKGEITKGKSGAIFRKALTILQFTISVFLIIGTIVVKKQLNFITSFDPGFETEQIAYTPLNSAIKKHFDTFKGKVLQNKNVLGLTRSNSFIMKAGSWTTITDGPERMIDGYYFGVDEDFFEFFNIEITKGRDFNENDLLRETPPYIVNRELADWYGSVDTAFTKKINQGEVIGVVENIQVTDLQSKPGPTVFQVKPEYAYLLYIKINAQNYTETVDYINDVWTEIAPEHPLDLTFLSDSFERIYRSEIQFGKVFMIFAVISIFLACLGLFALASFMSLKRTKEIGIRKALGSSTRSITLLLSKELTQWVLIANIIAAPLAYFAMNKWLNSFAYKTSLSWWIFVVAIVISLIIALSTIFYHTITTARKNPVDSLRYE
ncbi:MAG: ABC transporter permease [Bacteroidales bacterium]